MVASNTVTKSLTSRDYLTSVNVSTSLTGITQA